MASAIIFWRRSGRKVRLHEYKDAWHGWTLRFKTRPSNTYPRMREFWTEYFHEDKIVTLQSDTGGVRLCSLSPDVRATDACSFI